MTWAKESAERDKRVAKALYQQEKKLREKFGDQPFDPDSGKPIEKTPSGEKMRIHMLLREDPNLLMQVMAKVAVKKELSGAVYPKAFIFDLERTDRRYRGLAEDADSRLTEPSMEDISA